MTDVQLHHKDHSHYRHLNHEKLSKHSITIQKHYRAFKGRQYYSTALWEKMNEEERLRLEKQKEQVEEGYKLFQLTKEQFEKTDKVKDEIRSELDKSIQYEARERTWKTENFIDDLFYNLLDKNHVYKRAEKKAEKLGIKYEKEVSPYEIRQLLHDTKGTIDFFVERGALDFKTGEKIGPALKEIFKENNIKDLSTYKDFVRYGISKRAIEKNAQKLETGVNIKVGKKFVKENPQFEKPFRDAVKSSELALKYLYDAGVISKEVYKAALAANKDYVPFCFFDDVLQPCKRQSLHRCFLLG